MGLRGLMDGNLCSNSRGQKKKKNLILYVYDINIVLTSSSPVFATLFDVDFAFQSPPVLLLCSAH